MNGDESVDRAGEVLDPTGGDSDPERRAERADARAQRLAEENRRLRTEYASAHRTGFRRAAFGFAVLGITAALAGVVLETAQNVLFALGGTGVFAAILIYYLVPGQFVAAGTGERVYAPLADTMAAIATELGLRKERLYVPSSENDLPVYLYIPADTDHEIPSPNRGPIVTGEDDHGLVLQPTGGALFREFRYALSDGLARTPDRLAAQLADGIVEQFELAAVADPDGTDGRVTVGIVDSAFGDVDRLDHPIASFFACGLAVGLEQPVSLEVADGGSRYDWLVTCRWEVDG